jgi:hypothetical protein
MLSLPFKLWRGNLLSLVNGWRQAASSLGPSAGQDSSPGAGRHPFPETVIIEHFPVRWLICSFHLYHILYIIRSFQTDLIIYGKIDIRQGEMGMVFNLPIPDRAADEIYLTKQIRGLFETDVSRLTGCHALSFTILKWVCLDTFSHFFSYKVGGVKTNVGREFRG